MTPPNAQNCAPLELPNCNLDFQAVILDSKSEDICPKTSVLVTP
jgi:hypothetical protein